MKRGSFFYLLAAGVIVLLLTGMSGCSWLVSQSPSLLQGGSQTTPTAAMFVPKQASVMVSLLVNPDRLENSSVAAVQSEKRRQLRAELQKLKTSLLAQSGLDYRRDIKPWLGDEITFAISSPDIDRNSENGRQAGYLMAIATKDATKSGEFLQLLFSKRAIADRELMFEQYKGVKLIYDKQRVNPGVSPGTSKSSTSSTQTLAGAVVGNNFVLLANNPKVLRDAINNVQAPSLSLTSSSQYQQGLTLLPSNRIGLTFLNLPVISASRGLAPVAQTDKSQMIALQLHPQGLLAETTLLGTSIEQDLSTLPGSRPNGTVKCLPAATSFAISGVDLNRLNQTSLSQTWSELSTGLSGDNSNAISQLLDRPLAPLETRWGIDLPQDIFNWVQGEYALGLLPHADETAPDWILVVDSGEATAVSRLDAIASSQGLSISALTLEEQKIAAWTQLTTATTTSADPDHSTIALKAKVRGVHATVGNYEIFTTSIEAMDEALKAAQIGSLADNPNFKTGVEAISQPNQGYIYLDWKASQGILERQLPILKLIELAGNPLFGNLQSLTFSSHGNKTEALESSVFFQFDGA